LGLAVTKRIIEMYGGFIFVNSTLGRGTEFKMKLRCIDTIRKGISTKSD